MTCIRYIYAEALQYIFTMIRNRTGATESNSTSKIIQVNNHSNNNNEEQYKLLQPCDVGCADRLVPGSHTSEDKIYADGQALFLRSCAMNIMTRWVLVNPVATIE
jgi:hypothetical protein